MAKNARDIGDVPKSVVKAPAFSVFPGGVQIASFVALRHRAFGAMLFPRNQRKCCDRIFAFAKFSLCVFGQFLGCERAMISLEFKHKGGFLLCSPSYSNSE
jgi:hypothetical protein